VIHLRFHALVKKELKLYWNSPIAYIFIVVFLGFMMWLFFRGFFLINQAEMRDFFAIIPWIFLFLIPALTMRMWSEEYRSGCIETLLTSSITIREAVLAKFLASLIFLAITLFATILLPFSISLLGNLDWGVVFTSYFGALLLGGAYLSIGVALSAFTQNQIIAFITSILLCFTFFIIGDPIVTFNLSSFFTPILEFFSLSTHYSSIMRGVVDSRDLIFYISFIGFFLYLNIQTLKFKK
jgi:ABC-2 type transport system permease protein